MSLQKKNILITGGTSGIGRATAKLLLQNHANVFITGRNKDNLAKTISELKEFGNIQGIIADVTRYDDTIKAFNAFEKQLGIIDILINNASLPARSILDHTPSEIDFIISTNISGYLHYTKIAIEIMKDNKAGHIINIGSLSSEFEEKGADLYVASKSAIRGFTNSLRKKVNRYNIKVTEIEPGSTETSMISENKSQSEEMVKKMVLLKPEDIAAAILFCLSLPDRCHVMTVKIKAKYQLI